MSNKVTVTVSGPVGAGKSALCGEIEILCDQLGIQVEWLGGQEEKNLTGVNGARILEMYKPSVEIVEHIARDGEAPVIVTTLEKIALHDMLRCFRGDAGNGPWYTERIALIENLIKRLGEPK